MNITVAKSAGYCFGVERAIKIALKQEGNPATVLGHLIHNTQVTDRLRHNGIESSDSLDSVTTSTVIISAHGQSDRVRQNVAEKGFSVIDATCPLVYKVHTIAKKMEEEGRQVIIYGDKNHVEVKGIAGNLMQPIIVGSREEAGEIGTYAKIGLVSQTTQMMQKFLAVAEELKGHTADFRMSDTICLPTKQRQDAAEELAQKVELMIVVGGVKSSNTTKLYQICQKYAQSYKIETKDELKPEWFIGKNEVGVTAGASTPDWIIEEVVARIREFERGIGSNESTL